MKKQIIIVNALLISVMSQCISWADVKNSAQSAYDTAKTTVTNAAQSAYNAAQSAYDKAQATYDEYGKPLYDQYGEQAKKVIVENAPAAKEFVETTVIPKAKEMMKK